MKSKIIALIEIRKVITLLVTCLFIYLSVTKQLDVAFIMATISMVMGYYFGKSTALDMPRNSDLPDK